MTNPHKYIANESHFRIAIMKFVSQQTLSTRLSVIEKGAEYFEKTTRNYARQLCASYGMLEHWKQCR